MTHDHESPVISSTLNLASGGLSAQLRVEVSLARPAFSSESPLSDSRTNAMETLPAVLATEAGPMLRQILQAVEGQLLARLSDDLASGTSLLDGLRNRPKEPHAHLKDWVSQQTEPFTLFQAAKGIGLSQQKMTRDLQTRIGVALRKIGCKKIVGREFHLTKIMWVRPDRIASERPASEPANTPFPECAGQSAPSMDEQEKPHPTLQALAPGRHPIAPDHGLTESGLPRVRPARLPRIARWLRPLDLWIRSSRFSDKKNQHSTGGHP